MAYYGDKIKKVCEEIASGDHADHTCNRPMLIYSRVVGFIRPVENWNDAKREEFADRRTYKVFYGDQGS